MTTTQKYCLAAALEGQLAVLIFFSISEFRQHVAILEELTCPTEVLLTLKRTRLHVIATRTGAIIIKLDPTELYYEGSIPPIVNELLAQTGELRDISLGWNPTSTGFPPYIGNQ